MGKTLSFSYQPEGELQADSSWKMIGNGDKYPEELLKPLISNAKYFYLLLETECTCSCDKNWFTQQYEYETEIWPNPEKATLILTLLDDSDKEMEITGELFHKIYDFYYEALQDYLIENVANWDN